MQFHEKRRQQFLSENAFTVTTQFFTNTGNPGYLKTLHSSDTDPLGRSLVAEAIADGLFRNYMLRYTAGESLEILRDQLIIVVEAFEQAARYEREYEKIPDFPVFGFQEIDDF